jgi:hypothetical protein
MNVLKILSPLMPEGLFSLLSAGCECKTLHPRLDRVNRDQRTAGLTGLTGKSLVTCFLSTDGLDLLRILDNHR